jgi:hypothetical protein
MNLNWKQIVRKHLAVLRLSPEREIDIVEELALRLEPPMKPRSPVVCRRRKPRRGQCGATTGDCWNAN